LTAWKEPSPIGTLGAAYAEKGDFDLAIKYENQVLNLGKLTDAEVQASEDHILRYKKRQPLRW
jgi:hypothetical protein